LLNHGYGAFFQVEGLEFSGKNVWSHITLFNAWVGYMQCITMRIWKLLKEMSVIFNSLASVFFLCVVNVIQLEFVGNLSRYEAASHEATLATQREDFSDLVAEVNNTSPRSSLHVFFFSSFKQCT
jgi:hypothetical protein